VHSDSVLFDATNARLADVLLQAMRVGTSWICWKGSEVSQWLGQRKQSETIWYRRGKVGDGRDPKRVWGHSTPGKTRVAMPALHHPADVDDVQGVLGELASFLVGREEETLFAGIAEPGRIQVFKLSMDWRIQRPCSEP
jgi:hypothetical protein